MASGRDLSYTSSEMGGEGQLKRNLSPAKGYQGHDMSYNNSGEYTDQAQMQQMRHDEFIDQVSTFPGQNDQEYLQQIKTEEYLNQRNNMPGQNTNILQQTGEGVVHAAQGAVRGAANMAHGAAAGAANIAQGAASAVKHTLGMDHDSPHNSPHSTTKTGGATNYTPGNKYAGDPIVTSGTHSANYTTSYAKRNN